MNYDPSHVANPGMGAAARLVGYVSQGGDAKVVDSRGVSVSEDELLGFRASAAQSDSTAMHSFSFADDHDPDELLDAAHETLPDHLDGEYLIGVHEDTDKAHLHIAEAGTRDELYHPATAVTALGNDMADATNEVYG